MKLFRKLHLWLSIPFGVIISIICFTGALLVFEKEVTELCRPELYKVAVVEDDPLPLEVLIADVSQMLEEGTQITGVTIEDDPDRTYQMSLSKPARTSIYVDQYSGEVKGMGQRLPFFQTVFKLHRWLMGSARNEDGSIGLGKLVVGISTIMFVLIMLTGLVVWWPRNRKMLRNRFTIKFNKGWRRFSYDLHVAGGIYVTVILLALALTGLTWSFSWYRSGFYKVFGVEDSGGQRSQQGRQGRAAVQTDFCQWEKVYEELAVNEPEFSKISVSNGSAQVYFDRWGNQRASDKYKFDPATGEILERSLYKDSDKSSKIGGWIYSVHVGAWGGWFSRILTFFAALLGASLPVTGYYLWIKRLIVRNDR